MTLPSAEHIEKIDDLIENFNFEKVHLAMTHYVALIADATGRYAHVYVPGRNWNTVVDQLEDIGCEVVENQTDDYELEDFAGPENLKECGLVTIAQLTGTNSNFISC